MAHMWNVKDILEATGGSCADVNWGADSFSIDTRSIEPGQVFIALQGERVDGHDYVKAALEKGAVAVIVHHLVEGVDAKRQLLVEDTLEALKAMAVFHRARMKAKLVGVTGSVGKTSTKEALRTVLSTAGKTYASYGNYNNHIGTPLCLINMPLDAKFGVFEMGMNHSGEISQLSMLVKPHLAIITAVEAVHLEFFGTVEAIADAKAEIFDGMDKDGIATLNSDNPHFLRLKRAAEKHGLGKIISFGVNEMAICRLMEYRASATGSEITATISGTPVTYRMGTIGRHWALTSVAVLAAADALGCNLAPAAEALASFREPKGRGRLIPLNWAGGTLTLVDDSYNASPSSMKAAFEKMREIKAACPEQRMVAVLGDMLELGDLSSKMHAALAEAIQKAGIEQVHTAGKLMLNLHQALPKHIRGIHAEDADGLLALLLDGELQAGDTVLVKGSHGSQMWKLAEALQSHAGGSLAPQVKGEMHAV